MKKTWITSEWLTEVALRAAEEEGDVVPMASRPTGHLLSRTPVSHGAPPVPGTAPVDNARLSGRAAMPGPADEDEAPSDRSHHQSRPSADVSVATSKGSRHGV